MKELIDIMIPAEEWGEVKERWTKGDLRVVAYPLVWMAVALFGMWVAS